MLLSSGVIWRYDVRRFRARVPRGDEGLQRLVFERLDDAIAWLESLGAPVVGRRRATRSRSASASTRRLTDALVRAAATFASDDIGVPAPDRRAARARDRRLPGRPGARRALHRAGRAPAPARESVECGRRAAVCARARGRALRRHGRVLRPQHGRTSTSTSPSSSRSRRSTAASRAIFNDRGEEFFDHNRVSWSELDLVQATAHQPGARAWYVLDDEALEERVRYGTVRELVEQAPTRTELEALPFEPPSGAVVAVRVAAAITHTIGGLRVDEQARVLDEQGEPSGLFAAGADVGGISTGGYASGSRPRSCSAVSPPRPRSAERLQVGAAA